MFPIIPLNLPKDYGIVLGSSMKNRDCTKIHGCAMGCHALNRSQKEIRRESPEKLLIRVPCEGLMVKGPLRPLQNAWSGLSGPCGRWGCSAIDTHSPVLTVISGLTPCLLLPELLNKMGYSNRRAG